MSEIRAKFWAVCAVWGLVKAGVLMALLAWGHALDERLPALAYGPCLLLVLGHWLLAQEALDYCVPLLVRWVVPEDDEP